MHKSKFRALRDCIKKLAKNDRTGEKLELGHFDRVIKL